MASYARRKWNCRCGSDAFTLMLHAAGQQERTRWLRPTTGRQSGANSRPRFRKPGTVSASTLALHLDCSRTYIGKLEAEGVIQRQDDGFPLDLSRVAYLRYFRRERQRSPRAEADAGHVEVKTERLHMDWPRRSALVRRADVERSRRQ
jgi:hypothetical protein